MAHDYFKYLNYTLGNEDTSLELSIMPEQAKNILTVAGSGSRVTPLLSKNPKRVTCVDASKEQLSLCELRIETIKKLTYQDFLSFWGYPSDLIMEPDRRKEIFQSLDISKASRERMTYLFEDNAWGILLYKGKWERTFAKLSKLNRIIVGKKGLGIFSCRTLDDQRQYFSEVFPKKAWSFSVFVLGNAKVFNSFLYKGKFPKKNIPSTAHKFYLSAFDKLFNQSIARKNYFLQLLFFGKLQFSEGLPIECDPEVFNVIKKNLQKGIEIEYICGDVIDVIKKTKLLFDFISLSDTPSYFHTPLEQQFLQEINDRIAKDGLIVNRYYLHVPENLCTLGYRDVFNDHTTAVTNESTQMYSFGIYERK